MDTERAVYAVAKIQHCERADIGNASAGKGPSEEGFAVGEGEDQWLIGFILQVHCVLSRAH